MKTYKFLGIMLAACAFAACSNNQTPTTVPNAQNTTTTVTTPAPNAQQSPAATDSAALSPTDVFKSQNEARKKKDAATMKQNLSRASLALVEQSAKEDKMSVDEWLTIEKEGAEEADNFQTRNEKIDGDNATIEISLSGSEDWAVMPFVKEDGRWKLAMDKYLANLEKEFEENTEPVDESEEPKDEKPAGKKPEDK